MARHPRAYLGSIETDTNDNVDFRRVVATGRHLQLVFMLLLPGEEIGSEVHPDTDQFIRIERGRAMIELGGGHYPLHEGGAVLVPAGTRHNVVNIGTEPLKLYTLYGPPEHPPGERERFPT